MKSRISFFNAAVSRNYLRRFWPLWIIYFVLLLLMLPGTVSTWIQNSAPYMLFDTADLPVYRSGIATVYLSFFTGIAAAMAMFHYLYQTRSCGMMNTLPIRRETMFGTAFLTGLVPLLAADVLAAGITALLYLPGGQVTALALGKWLLMAVFTNLAFYGFAVLCAVLTGSLLVLPAVYVVLNLTAFVAENCARDILCYVVYGMALRGAYLSFLSPPVGMLNSLNVSNVTALTQEGVYEPIRGAYTLSGLGALAAYAAAGLALSAAALLLYRRRQMETATDVVAIPVLKPVFKYCLSVGTALVLTNLIYAWFFGGGLMSRIVYLPGSAGGSLAGRANALLVLALLLIGALVGYFAAEMLIQKTVRVFRGKWKGLFAVWAVLAALLLLCEFDVTGYETRVPEPGEVRSVHLNMARDELTEPESVEAVLRFHRELIDRRGECEGQMTGYTAILEYELLDGGTLRRSYAIPVIPDGESAEGTLLRQLEELINMPEVILSRASLTTPVTEENVFSASVYYNYVDANGNWQGSSYMLSRAEAVELYEQGILPDARAGRIAYNWITPDSAYYDRTTNCEINLELRLPSEDPENLNRYATRAPWDSLYITVSTDSENTLRWLRGHTDFEIHTQRELEELADRFAFG